ncbi:MAG: caspase family protein, partial [Trichodesmium sp. MAG_R04]|nr:caspase family protein [Trichodesmium sp. MAG_R04]
MAKNFAITIGINQYEHIPRPLNYAASDAEKVRDFLLSEANFNRVFYYSDYSPSINNISTRPTRSNLLRLLTVTFEKEFMGAGDNFWFFFSGHGARIKGIDYIIPSDAFSEDIETSAISVNYIIQRLQRCGADNVVLILDACREQGDSISKSIKGMGEQTEREAREKGVITICSCSANEYSWELEELQQGIFTYALLEGLGSKGRKATVERLNDYLEYRVKQLSQHKGRQTPRIMADPIEKSHLILMPKYATKTDVFTLKNDAYKAQMNRDFKLAERLWIRVLEIDVDLDAVEALQQIAIEKSRPESFSESEPNAKRQVKRKTKAQVKIPVSSPQKQVLKKEAELETNKTRRKILILGGLAGSSFLAVLTKYFWDMDTSQKYTSISQENSSTPQPTPSPTLPSQPKILRPIEESDKGESFNFKVVRVNNSGSIVNSSQGSAQQKIEDLGNGIKLEMVYIPGGTFTMGSPESEKGSDDDERPQHDVTVPPFFMGKYPVTQGQWRAIASRTDLKVELDLKPEPSYFKEPYKG